MTATRVSRRWHRLSRWVSYRQPVPQAGPAAPPPAFATDGSGSAAGGFRAPAADVPVAALSGLGQSGAALCFLFGAAAPFGAARLAARAPFTREQAADAMAAFTCPADARELF